MSARRQLTMMQHLADARYTIVQSEFASLTMKETRLIDTLKQLDAARTGQGERASIADTAVIAGADIRWQKWVDAKRGAINTELAQLRAQKLRLRSQLQRAFGKTRVLNELRRQEAVVEARDYARRET